MAKTIENLFTYIHFGTGILVVLFFLFYVKTLSRDKTLIALTFYAFCDILFNCIDEYLLKKWAAVLWACFTFLEYLTFAYFLYVNIQSEKIKKIVLLSIGLFLAILITYYSLTPIKNIVDSIPIGIETIFILIFLFYYLFEQMSDTTSLFIYNKYQFWIVIGIMIYLAGSFFIFIFTSRVEKKLIEQFWFLTNAFYSTMNVMFIVAFLLKRKNDKISGVNQHQKLRPYLN
jgi:hypothetical protein